MNKQVENKACDEDLICFHCGKIFQSVPITLFPCGWVICSHHFGDLMKTFNCYMCSKNHPVNVDQCIKTKNLEFKYLKYKVNESLKKFEEEINELDQIKKDPVNYLDDVFVKLINKIDLQREMAKKQIDSYFDKLYGTINMTRKNFESAIDKNNEFKYFSTEKMSQDKDLFKEELSNMKDAKNSYLSIVDLRSKIKQKRESIKTVVNSLTESKSFEIETDSFYLIDFSKFGKIETKPIQNEIDLDRKNEFNDFNLGNHVIGSNLLSPKFIPTTKMLNAPLFKPK
ncbi:hypothetical protein BpHYR1_054507 [Brachionus plicatilis]|uniref:Uncharacterized protein n=1 Tax=Brachionus plicatilis TaxID=10195 RepID=A0A3M7PWI2_BRAPC|nr:hypothetical protein BpHYR1_054507 [Brachionus plicatilis]